MSIVSSICAKAAKEAADEALEIIRNENRSEEFRKGAEFMHEYLESKRIFSE